MRKKLLFAMLAMSPLSAWAADPWCSPQGSTVFIFEWAPADKADPARGSVNIKLASSGKTVQRIDGVENYDASANSLRIRDFNNDGCADLAVVGSVAGIGNESNTVFLYTPRNRRFALHKRLSEIGGLEIDHRDKNCVTGSWKGGASNFYSSKHCWRGGKLVMKSEYSVGPLIDADGNLQCYQHVETEYRAGKKKIKKSCTQDL